MGIPAVVEEFETPPLRKGIGTGDNFKYDGDVAKTRHGDDDDDDDDIDDDFVVSRGRGFSQTESWLGLWCFLLFLPQQETCRSLVPKFGW